MLTFSGEPAPDGWYHAGIMSREETDEAIYGTPDQRRIPYLPDDPRATDQRPYLEYLETSTTATYQQESAR